jgi:hypothetical protein
MEECVAPFPRGPDVVLARLVAPPGDRVRPLHDVTIPSIAISQPMPEGVGFFVS